jgi:hypothetical protein
VPGKYVSFCEVTALEEPNLIAWKSWVEGVMRTQWEFHLTGNGGGTHLVQVSRWESAGPIGYRLRADCDRLNRLSRQLWWRNVADRRVNVTQRQRASTVLGALGAGR